MTDNQLDNIFFQIGHFLGGYAAVLTLFVCHVQHWLLISIMGVTLWASVKEFYWDPRHEDPEVRGSDLEDFIFYIVGLIVGVGLCGLAGS